MEFINHTSVAKAFLNLIKLEHEDNVEELRDEHFAIAEILVQKLDELLCDHEVVNENENIEGGLKSDVELCDDDGTPILEETVSLDYKTKAVKAFHKHKGKWKFSTFQNKYPRVLYPYYIRNWEMHMKMGGTKYDLYKRIEAFVMQRFRESREDCLTVHDSDLQRWGIQSSGEFPGFKFKASASWLLCLKNRNGIVSRKIQKILSHRSIREKDQLLETAKDFRNEIRPLFSTFDPKNVWNTDQTGFRYEPSLGSRTLSWKGERSTFGAALSPKNKATHSYTIQYVISLSGHIVGDAFICLQEVQGKLGPHVQDNIFLAPNLTVTCSRSGKLSTGHVEYFLDHVIQPHATGDILYITDKWTGHKDEDLYSSRFKNEDVNMTLKLIPENCTDICQPLDTYFHRQLKYLVRQFYNHAMLHQNDSLDSLLSSRDGILRIQSLTHFILSAPVFIPMIQYCWYSSGLWNEDIPIFRNVKDVCFDVENLDCNTQNCSNRAFIACSWCSLTYCFDDFFHDYHLIQCARSPFL